MLDRSANIVSRKESKVDGQLMLVGGLKRGTVALTFKMRNAPKKAGINKLEFNYLMQQSDRPLSTSVRKHSIAQHSSSSSSTSHADALSNLQRRRATLAPLLLPHIDEQAVEQTAPIGGRKLSTLLKSNMSSDELLRSELKLINNRLKNENARINSIADMLSKKPSLSTADQTNSNNKNNHECDDEMPANYELPLQLPEQPQQPQQTRKGSAIAFSMNKALMKQSSGKHRSSLREEAANKSSDEDDDESDVMDDEETDDMARKFARSKSILRERTLISTKSMSVDKWLEACKRNHVRQAMRNYTNSDAITRKFAAQLGQQEAEKIEQIGTSGTPKKIRSTVELRDLSLVDRVQARVKRQLEAKLLNYHRAQRQDEFNAIVDKIGQFLDTIVVTTPPLDTVAAAGRPTSGEAFVEPIRLYKYNRVSSSSSAR